ncbi:hypothetical protein [Petrachloros mirabilis]
MIASALDASRIVAERAAVFAICDAEQSEGKPPSVSRIVEITGIYSTDRVIHFRDEWMRQESIVSGNKIPYRLVRKIITLYVEMLAAVDTRARQIGTIEIGDGSDVSNILRNTHCFLSDRGRIADAFYPRVEHLEREIRNHQANSDELCRELDRKIEIENSLSYRIAYLESLLDEKERKIMKLKDRLRSRHKDKNRE